MREVWNLCMLLLMQLITFGLVSMFVRVKDDEDPLRVRADQGQRESPQAAEPAVHPLRLVHPLREQPVNTFQYLPHDYTKPTFEKSKHQQADEIAARVEQSFTEEVVTPRKKIDELLRSFRLKTGKSPDAVLTMCFEQWMSEAFNDMELPAVSKPAFKVELNKDNKVKSIVPNVELGENLSDVTEDMSKLLGACHEFLDRKDDIHRRLRKEKEEFDTHKFFNTKTNNAKKEIESLFPELDELAEQVEGLLINLKLAASKVKHGHQD